MLRKIVCFSFSGIFPEFPGSGIGMGIGMGIGICFKNLGLGFGIHLNEIRVWGGGAALPAF